MKYFVIVFIALFTFSCAHHHERTEHHHHAYEKSCAYSVMSGDYKQKGKDEYQLEHGGKTYFFSTKDRMDKFKAHLNENIAEADRNWVNRRR